MSEQYPTHAGQEPVEAIPGSYESEKLRTHPTLTFEQEQIIFAALRAHDDDEIGEYTVKQLLEETELRAMIGQLAEGNQTLWNHVLDRSGTVRELLLRCYDAYAWDEAVRFRGLPFPLEDKIAVSRVGLLDAIDTFDPTRGVRFTTRAHYAIFPALQKEMCTRYKISMTDWIRLRVARQIAGAFFKVYGRDPTRAELELQLLANADNKEGRPYMPVSRRDYYADMYVSMAWRQDKTHTSSVYDLEEPTDQIKGHIEIPPVLSAEDAVLAKEADETISAAIVRLPDRNRRFIQMVTGYYGQALSKQEAANMIGIAPEDAESFYEGTLELLRLDSTLQDMAPSKGGQREKSVEATTTTMNKEPALVEAPAIERRLANLTPKELSALLVRYEPHMRETVALAWRGLSVEQIAKKRGVSRPSIYSWLRKFQTEQGIDSLPNHKRRRQEQAIEMYQDGIDVAEISKRIGVTRSSIMVYLKESGVLPTQQERTEEYRAAYDAALHTPAVQAVRAVLMEEIRSRPKTFEEVRARQASRRKLIANKNHSV